MRRRLRATAAAAALAALAAACGPDDAVVVLAASSVAPAVEAAAEAAGIGVAVVGAGSQVLVAQFEAGAPADLVLLAEPDLARRLVALGLPEPVRLTSTTLSLVGRVGLGLDFDAALRDPGLTIVLAEESVPLGAASRRALDLLDPGVARGVLDRVRSLEDSASSVLAKVEAGEADLAIVYTANAGTASRDGRVEVLGAFSPTVIVDVLAQPVTPAGQELLARLGDEAARQVFGDFGFQTFA